MQIAYLNTNGFFGITAKGKREQNKIFFAEKILNRIFEYVKPDVLFFSEFDKYSPAGQYSLDFLKNKGFSPIYPDGRTEMSDSYSSYVVAFARTVILSKRSPKDSLAYKWNEILLDDLRIVGVHIPSSYHEPDRANKYWTSLYNHCISHSEDKIIYIGDMNVYDDDTDGKKHFNKITTVLRDGWYETHNSNSTDDDYTSRYNKRIDYVLLSDRVGKEIAVENFQSFYKDGLTDHSMIVLKI